MDSKPAMEAIKARAFKARIPLYRLAERAKVSPARFTQHNNGEQVSIAVLRRLEGKLDDIEREQREMGAAVLSFLGSRL